MANVENSNKPTQTRLARAAVQSAVLVAAIACAVTCCLLLVWASLTHGSRIVWAVTLGGEFWGGFAIAMLGRIIAGWAFCTITYLTDDRGVHYRAIGSLKVITCVGIGISALADYCLGQIIDAVANLPPSQQIAIWLIPLTYIVYGGCLLYYLLFGFRR